MSLKSIMPSVNSSEPNSNLKKVAPQANQGQGPKARKSFYKKKPTKLELVIDSTQFNILMALITVRSAFFLLGIGCVGSV
jgi:hypothetical protein